MSSPSAHNNIRLLAEFIDYNDEDVSEYRLLVDEKHVKYVTVDPEVLPKQYRTFESGLRAVLPPLPPGEWNEAHVSVDTDTGRPVFSRTTNNDLPGVTSVWHEVRIDQLDLEQIGCLRPNLRRVTHPMFDRPVLAKFAAFPWQVRYLEAETSAYEWIDGKGIGPEFLGHVTEAGRVIGFLMEDVNNARPAVLADLTECRSLLIKLHALPAKHGNINKDSFLMKGGRAVLLDFETTRKTSNMLTVEHKHLIYALCNRSYQSSMPIPVMSGRLSC
ncbi:hypothetical protein ACHAQA_007587 [Verticillium albo-atrum]